MRINTNTLSSPPPSPRPLPTNLDVLGEEVVAVGAVVEHHLVEGGVGQLLHLAVVVAAVPVLADHPLARRQLPHGRLAPLGGGGGGGS